MHRTLFALCLCGGMTGCASVFPAPTALLPLPPEAFASDEFEIPTVASPAEIAALPPGSQVALSRMTETSRFRVTGEVLHASSDGVALMNVTREAREEHGTPILSKVPYVNRLFKNTGVGMERLPVYWVPIRQIATAQVLQAPPDGYVAPQLAINTDDRPYFERIGIDFDFNVDGEMVTTNSIQYVPGDRPAHR